MERYQEEAVGAISDLVKTNSALAKGTPRTPFGEGAAKCLADFLALAEGMGFEAHNYDNYAGEVIFGEGEEFAILCHLDVVPAGEGWTHIPSAARSPTARSGAAARRTTRDLRSARSMP